MAKKRIADQMGPARSKKQKRRISHLVPSKVDQPIAQSARPPASETPRPAPSSISSIRARQAVRAQRPGLITDYSYVISDLRRVGLVATLMLAIIVVLSFLIR